MSDNIQFNEKMKFSWGHIIAALALIAIAYCTFVGVVYLLKGQFLISGLITMVITLLIGLLFLIPQQLKATERRFEKRIKWERAFIFASPVLFIVLMIPFSHAWTVHHRQQQILDSFNQTITSATGMFDQYETYCNIRTMNYRHTLGIADTADISVENANKLEILHLALLSSNYDTLKNSALAWMDKSVSGDVSTWNVFILGNITEIQSAIHQWYDDLQFFSSTKLSEEEEVKAFDNTSQYINDIDNTIATLTANYSNIVGFSPMTLLWLLLGYAMLLFPYLLQSRHSKTIGTNWTLFGFRNKKTPKPSKPQQENPVSNGPDNPDDTASFSHNTQTSDEDEKYESFKM